MCISRVFGHSHHWRDLLLFWRRELKVSPSLVQNPSPSAHPNYSYMLSENHQFNVLIKNRQWVVSLCVGYWCNISRFKWFSSYLTEKLCISFGLLEERLIFAHSVLVHCLFSACFVRQLSTIKGQSIPEISTEERNIQSDGSYLTPLCSSWLLLACMIEGVSATCVNFTLPTFWRYFFCIEVENAQLE